MGEQTDRKIYFSVNGVDYTEFIGFQTVTLETAESGLSLDGGTFLNDVSLTGSIKFPKVLRCRNRKRFVKLLMSIGYPRNFAEKIRVAPGDSYDFLWWRIFLQWA